MPEYTQGYSTFLSNWSTVSVTATLAENYHIITLCLFIIVSAVTKGKSGNLDWIFSLCLAWLMETMIMEQF